MNETDLARTPTVVYGVNLLGAAMAYYFLVLSIERLPYGRRLRDALGKDVKGKISPVLYLLGIGLTFIEPWLGALPFVAVAVMWLAPDRRVERYLEREGGAVTDESGAEASRSSYCPRCRVSIADGLQTPCALTRRPFRGPDDHRPSPIEAQAWARARPAWEDAQ